jgi:hypothetical protein
MTRESNDQSTENLTEIQNADQIEREAAQAYRSAFTETLSGLEANLKRLRALMKDWNRAALKERKARGVADESRLPEPIREATGKGPLAETIAKSIGWGTR